MNYKGTLAKFIVCIISCVTVMIYGCFSFLCTADRFTAEENISINSTVTTISDIKLPKKTDSSAVSSSAPSSSKAAESKAVPAASKDEAIGKVTEKFISPYTAKTSYKNIYVKNSTDLNINIKSLYEAKLKYNIEENNEPQVLIMHTHTTESFLPESRDFYTSSDRSRTTDESKNMVALGNIVTDKLNQSGIKTLHDKTTHDYPSYNESYNRASKTILSYLKKYPSIKIVIDMHRDAISPSDTEKVKLTTEINGKKAAQIMLVQGSQSGNVKNFPNWQENLKLALKLQESLETKYPTLARSLSLMSRNYNESLSTGSMLIEIGTDANSLEEVKYSAELLGNTLSELLKKL